MNRPNGGPRSLACTICGRPIVSGRGSKRTCSRACPVLVFKRDGWVCQICNGKTNRAMRGSQHPDAPEIDHRIALSRGGSHTWSNVQTAHRRCNQKKHTRPRGQIPLWNTPAGVKQRTGIGSRTRA